MKYSPDELDAMRAAPVITKQMIAAGVREYEAWEPDHIFGDYTPAAPYAVSELILRILRAALKRS